MKKAIRDEYNEKCGIGQTAVENSFNNKRKIMQDIILKNKTSNVTVTTTPSNDIMALDED